MLYLVFPILQISFHSLVISYSVPCFECQASIPFGEHDNYPISLSFIASHGTDKFLLDTVLDMYSSLQEEVSIQSSASPLPDANGSIDASELLKEKVLFYSFSFNMLRSTA